MYTIGQFSRVCHVTTKAIRHYEKIGLLSPAQVDRGNLYRYYTREQVSLVKKISLMKDLGIPLKVIKRIIDRETRQEEVMAMLEEHRQLLEKQQDLCRGRLAKLSWWQKTLEVGEMTETKKYDIYVRDVPEMPVRSRRKVLTAFLEELPDLIRSELEELISMGGVCAGPLVILYHDEEFNPQKVDVEVCWPVLDGALASKTLPPVRAASCMHVGPYTGLESAYEAVYSWINRNGYRALTPMREVSYNDPRTTPPEQLVTEIIIPVEKV